jgi:hypothetical protein
MELVDANVFPCKLKSSGLVEKSDAGSYIAIRKEAFGLNKLNCALVKKSVWNASQYVEKNIAKMPVYENEDQGSAINEYDTSEYDSNNTNSES